MESGRTVSWTTSTAAVECSTAADDATAENDGAWTTKTNDSSYAASTADYSEAYNSADT
jgi:hypothetical protein